MSTYVSHHVAPDAPVGFTPGSNNVALLIGDASDGLCIAVGHRFGADGVAWLRRLAVVAEEAAEEMELAIGQYELVKVPLVGRAH